MTFPEPVTYLLTCLSGFALMIAIFVLVIVLILFIRVLYGKDLKVFKGKMSPKDGIQVEIETHEPKFLIDLEPVKADTISSTILPLVKEKVLIPRNEGNAKMTTNSATQDPQEKLKPTSYGIFMDDLDLEPLGADFMSDEYIIQIATQFQLNADEDDHVVFVDRTIGRDK